MTLVRLVSLGVAVCFANGSAAQLSAQGTNTSGDSANPSVRVMSASAVHASAPTITAALVKRSISIDGRLSESDWESAVPATRFTATEPVDGLNATERTEVRVLYDDDAIYIGARLFDSSGKVSSRLGRRDTDLSDSDWFIVVFDSYHDHTGGYRFRVNPAGVFGDEANGDRSWNPVWTVSTAIDSLGWTAEMRIPFSQLRFSSAPEQLWGIQFNREIRSKAEKTVFSYSSRGERGGSSRFGHLVGVRDVKRGKTIEVLPYVSARAELKNIPLAANTSFANPYRTGRDRFQQVGADIKYRLTSNFTVDATVDPDFGQIEADEQQVNLTANEQYFREQRPFFIEGANTFRFGLGVGGGGGFGGGGFGGGGGGGGGGSPPTQIFYSRRVGRSPQGSVPSMSRYSNMPTQSAIVGAAKITGRTANGWQVGISEAVTARETAPWVDSAARPFSSEVEPRSNYFVTRIKKDFREGLSTVGGIATSVHRDLSDSTMASRLRTAAYVSGLDFGHLFGNRTWEISGNAVGSYIAGSVPVILAAQRSSVRFYQRPDADYLNVDSAAVSLAGWAGALNINKSAGLHWTGDLRSNFISPGYEINDLGFQNNADRITISGGINYDERIPGKHLRNWGFGVRPEYRTNFGGDLTGLSLRGDVNVQLLNFMAGRINLGREFSSLDDRLTRGGPMSATVPGSNISVNLNGDSRKPYTWNLSASERWDDSQAWSQSRGVRFGFRPTSWWNGELGPNYSRSRNNAQYITRITDAVATHTYGSRYIFSEIRQTTLSMQARLNLILSPRLGLSMVAEPFIASGQYGTPKELRTQRQFVFNEYGVDVGSVQHNTTTKSYVIDPDGTGPASAFTVSDRSFNNRSMNATANIRWDWRDGSTFFLVWQHRRANPAQFGNFDWNRDARDLFGTPSENTLMFKFNYWLNM